MFCFVTFCFVVVLVVAQIVTRAKTVGARIDNDPKMLFVATRRYIQRSARGPGRVNRPKREQNFVTHLRCL